MCKRHSAVAAAAWLAGVAPAAVINVPADYPTIQAAIDAAVNGDEVVVAQGVYTGPGNRDIDFGGRLITVRSANGPEKSIIDCQGTLQDPHRGVRFHNGETAAAVLDGFTIRNGSVGTGYPGQGDSGGGIRCDNASPTIVNCIITGCSSHVHDCCAAGGGIYVGGGSPAILDCHIIDNVTGFWGGGIFCGGGSPIIAGCRIEFNHSGSSATGGSGGGIFIAPSANPTIVDCDITGNSSANSGGISSGTGSILNCRFVGNYTTSYGGGLGAGASAVVVNCIFTGNFATYGGGGLWTTGLVANCVFTGNDAGISLGGKARVSNCTVAGNYWGITTFSTGEPELRNTVVWDNPYGQIFVDASAFGGTTLTVAHCDIQDGQDGAVVEAGSTLLWGPGNISAEPMFVDVDGADGVPGTADDDLRLMGGSPCIDAGNNWAVSRDEADLDGDGDESELAPLDLDGNPRFADGPADDTGCGVPVIVDMGAYEFQGNPFPVQLGDVDGDGAVGVTDFLDLLGDWGPCSEACCLSDLDLNGEVAVTDLLLLLDNWR